MGEEEGEGKVGEEEEEGQKEEKEKEVKKRSTRKGGAECDSFTLQILVIRLRMELERGRLGCDFEDWDRRESK